MKVDALYSPMPGNVRMPVSPTPRDTAHAEILLIDADAVTGRLAPILRAYAVVASSSLGVAREFLRRRGAPAMIITELELTDGTGSQICREAKALPTPPIVLITTAAVDRAPEALEAGCDGVLLKPFAPNLLAARVGRLINGRNHHSWHDSRPSGTNRLWPDLQCPNCDAKGVISFEFASHRRAWYSCGSCKKVWLGRRHE
jgi:DNA-binding response OmpR family regulator